MWQVSTERSAEFVIETIVNTNLSEWPITAATPNARPSQVLQIRVSRESPLAPPGGMRESHPAMSRLTLLTSLIFCSACAPTPVPHTFAISAADADEHPHFVEYAWEACNDWNLVGYPDPLKVIVAEPDSESIRLYLTRNTAASCWGDATASGCTHTPHGTLTDWQPQPDWIAIRLDEMTVGTISHEIGHVLGLRHSKSTHDVMSSPLGAEHPTVRDVVALKELYGN